jgi:hypothetical protein
MMKPVEETSVEAGYDPRPFFQDGRACLALAAVVSVGDGRGFVVEGRERARFIITAAHCLPYVPPSHGFSGFDEPWSGVSACSLILLQTLPCLAVPIIRSWASKLMLTRRWSKRHAARDQRTARQTDPRGGSAPG